MDDVLARQARDVGARPADVFAVDYRDALSFASKRPRSDGRAGAATENHEIKFFRLRVHADFPFRATGSLVARIDLTSAADDAPSSDSP